MSSLNFFCCLSELTIGFEQASYTAQEGTPVEVCAVILEGSFERSVIFTFGAQDRTAGEGYDIADVYRVHLFVAVYPRPSCGKWIHNKKRSCLNYCFR